MSQKLTEFWYSLPIPESTLGDEKIVQQSRISGRGPSWNFYIKFAVGLFLLLVNIYAVWNMIDTNAMQQKHEIITQNLWINP